MKFFFSVALLIHMLPSYAQIPLYNVNPKDSVAVGGFDVVSYFQEGEPLKGKTVFCEKYKGNKYLFANKKNLEVFLASPDKYVPAYGGWCAYSMAITGQRVVIDPLNYKVYNNKLYVFYNQLGNNTKERWLKERRVLMSMANKNWRLLMTAVMFGN